jgi:glycine cleavage system transcriptional repressor
MTSYLLLTASGPDRPGLVDELSAGLAGRGLNIEGSRMAVLGGEFAVILLASGPEAEIQRLAQDPGQLAGTSGLSLTARLTGPSSVRVMPASLPYRLVTAGMDHPGIVHNISQVLRRFEVNIEAMDTRVSPAPVSGAPMFTMTAELSVPAAVKIKRLRQALEDLGEELNMDLEFEPRETG